MFIMVEKIRIFFLLSNFFSSSNIQIEYFFMLIISVVVLVVLLDKTFTKRYKLWFIDLMNIWVVMNNLINYSISISPYLLMFPSSLMWQQ